MGQCFSWCRTRRLSERLGSYTNVTIETGDEPVPLGTTQTDRLTERTELLEPSELKHKDEEDTESELEEGATGV